MNNPIQIHPFDVAELLNNDNGDVLMLYGGDGLFKYPVKDLAHMEDVPVYRQTITAPLRRAISEYPQEFQEMNRVYFQKES